jgi:hypothetical protein
MTSGTVQGPDLAVLVGAGRLAAAIDRGVERPSGAGLNLFNSRRVFVPPRQAG